MTPAEVLALLKFLDTLFQLGGKLVLAAMEKTPILQTEPLPTLFEVDAARQEAIERINHE